MFLFLLFRMDMGDPNAETYQDLCYNDTCACVVKIEENNKIKKNDLKCSFICILELWTQKVGEKE